MRASLVSGVIAGPLFVLTFLIAGATRPDYDPVRHPVSSLALGPFGWVQTANFVVGGLLMLALAVGLVLLPGARQKVGAVLVGVWAVGLLGAGAFVIDPVSGYPPGTPAVPDEATVAGTLHNLFAAAAFLSLGAACFVLAAGGRRWALYSVLSGVALLATFIVSGIGLAQADAVVDVAGLWQRISMIIGWVWLTVLALGLLRSPATRAGPPSVRA